MSRYFKNSIKAPILAFFTALILCGAGNAQDGRWVEYSLTGLGSGSTLSDRGDGLLGYTKGSSRYFLVFDIGPGEWQRIDLGAVQSWQYVETEGAVLMAWSSELLLGYSAITQTWDTVSYDGAVLNVDYQAGRRSYGCSDSLAFFASNQKLYVFDATAAAWQEHAFTVPGDYVLGDFRVKDDYVVLTFGRSTLPSQPKNVVWSRHVQGFNELEYGCRPIYPILDHGFMNLQSLDVTGNEYAMIGYSAFTNEFAVVNHGINDPIYQSVIAGLPPSGFPADEFSAYGLGFRTVVTPYELVTCTFYGYDTYHGEWDSLPVSFDWEVESYYGNCHIGGRYSVDFSSDKDVVFFKYFIYDGINGVFRIKTPGIRYKSTYYSFQCGGTVYACYDTLNAWGYDVAGDRENLISLAGDVTDRRWSGEDWVSLSRYSTGNQENMTVYFYNGNTNQWSSAAMPYDLSYDQLTSPHICMGYDWESGELIHYSSLRDEITKKIFTPQDYVSMKIRGDLAYAASDQNSYLFNGLTGFIYEKDFKFSQNGLGNHSAAFADTATKTLHGYSTLSETWTELTIAEDPYYVNDTGYIGIVSAWYNGNGYGKFYAFNGMADSWVGLVPQGNYVGVVVGERTVLVERSTKVYAFDPQRGMSDVGDGENRPDDVLPISFDLNQNYPNPFNPSTTIRYTVPRKLQVTVTIFNILGQDVRTLVDEERPAGSYTVTWDGVDNTGKPAATGIYLYRFTAGNRSETRKMLLVK